MPQVAWDAQQLFAGGGGSGSVLPRLLAHNGDFGALRPWLDEQGRPWITVNTGRCNDKGEPILQDVFAANAPSTLRIREWIALDQTVVEAAVAPLTIWGDMQTNGLTYDVPDGMGVTVLQHQTRSRGGAATISMSPVRRSERDRITFDLGGTPLPIIHEDFSFDFREVMVSRRQGLPIDTSMASEAARNVGEAVEDFTLGVSSSYSYGGYTAYGLTNSPLRMTKTLTNPTAGGWTPDVLIDEILDMQQQMSDQNHFGECLLYYSFPWTKYLSKDYSAAYRGGSLLNRLREVPNLRAIRPINRLTGFQLLLVEVDKRWVRAITGMPITTLQWDSDGGMVMNYKIMCIMVPQVRADYNNTTGLVHGVAP